MAGGGVDGVVVVVVVAVVLSPVLSNTDTPGLFLVSQSCDHPGRGGGVVTQRYLVVNSPMWLRADEEVTLQDEGGSEPCQLRPNTTYRVRPEVFLLVYEEGSGDPVCHFPPHAVFHLTKGRLRVSCRQGREEAEQELLVSLPEAPPGSVTPSGQPEGRDLDLDLDLPPPTDDVPAENNSRSEPGTTEGPQHEISHESLIGQATSTESMEDLFSTRRPGSSTRTSTFTARTTAVTRQSSSTEDPQPTAETGTKKTTTTEKLTTENEGKETTTKTVSSTKQLETTKESVLPSSEAPEPSGDDDDAMKESTLPSNATQLIAHASHTSDDHLPYLAGAGAGIVLLVLGAVVVVVVCLMRRKKPKNKKQDNYEEFFISGAYKGSLGNLTHSNSYNNAHIMYSGADPEFAESFELEERILNSGVSYSSHDIPKCLHSGDKEATVSSE